MRVESQGLQDNRLEPFIRPTLGIYLLTIGFQHYYCRGCISSREVNPGLTEWEIVSLRKVDRCRQIALAKKHQHLCSGHFRYPMDKFMLAHRLIGLRQEFG